MDKTWEAPGGFLGFSARFARTGIQMYDGAEIDPDGEHKLTDGARRFKPGTLYPVERPAEEVFSKRAMSSFIAKPLTNDHPSQGVDVDNWRDLTGGVIGETLRDGEYARLSGLMTDKALIADYRAGKKELSGGYSAKLVIGDGVNAKGETFVAKQTEIDGNHVAFVTRGRAGSECRVVDAAPCAAAPTAIFDSLTNDGESIVTTKTITFDGLPLLVTDAAEAAIGKLQAQIATLTTDKVTLETNVATLTTDKATLEAEKVTLTKQVADAALTPAQLRDAAKSYATVIGKAQAMGVTVADSMDEPAIKRAVVDKALGDLAKGWNDVQVDASFASLTKDAKVADTAVQPLGAPVIVADADKSRNAFVDRLSSAWKGPQAAAA